MDPNVVLRRIRLLSELVMDGQANPDEVFELAEAITALDEWLGRGGFAPDWTQR